jgi:biopolymer transport protein ExbB
MKTTTLLFSLIGYFLIQSAQVFADANAEILERISTSQAELASSQASIERESSSYYRRLNRIEAEIKSLRDKAAGAKRLADEKLLSLEKLEERVDKWQAQSSYQSHLLSSFLEGSELLQANSISGEEIDASIVAASFAEIKGLLSPEWKNAPIILASGDIQEVPTLKVGPIAVAMNGDAAGLMQYDIASNARISYQFSSKEKQELEQLFESREGGLTFDPTLGNAQDLIEHEGSVYSHVEKGGVWVVPILVFALLSLTASIVKAVQLIRLPTIDVSVAEKVVQLKTKSPDKAELKSKIAVLARSLGEAQSKLLSIWARWPSSEQRDDLFVAHIMEYRHSIERYMGIIATSAAIAPLLGLLGTVSGMINTFKMMTIFGAGDASTVSGGISEALVTTELGLVVAIPSLIMSALLSRKIKSYCHKLEASAVRLSKV